LSLPVNSVTALIIAIFFIAVLFAMVSGVIDSEKQAFLEFVGDKSPEGVGDDTGGGFMPVLAFSSVFRFWIMKANQYIGDRF